MKQWVVMRDKIVTIMDGLVFVVLPELCFMLPAGHTV
jgi:hypothetical protein